MEGGQGETEQDLGRERRRGPGQGEMEGRGSPLKPGGVSAVVSGQVEENEPSDNWFYLIFSSKQEKWFGKILMCFSILHLHPNDRLFS